MKKIFFIGYILFLSNEAKNQNVGIGTTAPSEKLEVSGNIKLAGLTLNNGGAQFDFLQKNNAGGQIGFKKGHGGLGLQYIICVQGGTVPSATVLADGPYLSEIKLFAGDYAPPGWMFCEGQILLISQYTSLYPLLQTTYGGNGSTTFALPDLRGAAPVGAGTSPAGNTWNMGQKTN